MFYRLLRVLPWGLRLALFAAIAAPLVNMKLVTMWSSGDPLGRILATASYAVFVWVFVIACIGWDKFFTYVSVAAVMCVATAIIGSAIRSLFGLGGATEAEKHLISEQTVNVVFMLMISLPYAFFVIQAFSASRLLESVSRQAGNVSAFRMHLSVWLRVFQHLTEVFPVLLLVWKEENPSLLLPRHVDDWRSQHILRKLLALGDWVINAALIWARCLLVFSLRIVPVVNLETARLATEKPQAGKVT